MSRWTNVNVFPTTGGNALLDHGTGSGTMGQFAFSKFPHGRYAISAVPDDAVFPIDWHSICTFSGEVSEFKQA